jgi:F0F1-type ATP synthase alpha subunit
MVTSEISKFESKFIAHLKGSHTGLLNKIRTEGKLDPADEENLNNILEAFIPDCGCAMKQ